VTGNIASIHYPGLVVNTSSSNAFIGLGTNNPKSATDINGSVSYSIIKVVANTTLNDSHYTVIGDTSSSSLTITLPSAVNCLGRMYRIKRSGGNTMDIQTSSGQTIDLSGSSVSLSNLEVKVLQSDGSNWWLV